MFPLPVSYRRSDSGVSKRKKKEGSRFCCCCCYAAFYWTWLTIWTPGTGYAGLERVQSIALALFWPQIAALTSITAIQTSNSEICHVWSGLIPATRWNIKGGLKNVNLHALIVPSHPLTFCFDTRDGCLFQERFSSFMIKVGILLA